MAEPQRESQWEISDDLTQIDLVICPACDEPFSPQFYRLCQSCGHDFGIGIEVDEEIEPIGNRALIVMAGLLVMAGAAVVYFYFLYDG